MPRRTAGKGRDDDAEIHQAMGELGALLALKIHDNALRGEGGAL